MYNPNNIDEYHFDKNIYEKKIEKDLKKININRKDLDEIVMKFFNEIKDETKDEDYIYDYQLIPLDIYSPFFDVITKSKIYYQYAIPIPINVIKKYNLKDDYVSIFNSNSNLISLKIYYKDIEDINYLKELKINFKNIKGLYLCINEEYGNEEEEEEEEEVDQEKEDEKKENENNIKNYDFLRTFFSVDNFGVNIIKLKLHLPKKGNNGILEQNLLENLNNLKSLRTLELSRFKFKNKCEINITNLKK
jgi:hypothetical protein